MIRKDKGRQRELKKLGKQFEELRKHTRHSREPTLQSAPRPKRQTWPLEDARAQERAWNPGHHEMFGNDT